YERLPMTGVHQLGKFIRTVDRELPDITVPALILSSVEDHTVKPANARRVVERLGSGRKEFVALSNSYHVATLDYDAEDVFARTLADATRLVILSLAAAGGYVILGRGGQAVLRDRPDAFHLSLVGDLDDRVRRVQASQGIGEREARALCERVDGDRAAYVHRF